MSGSVETERSMSHSASTSTYDEMADTMDAFMSTCMRAGSHPHHTAANAAASRSQ
jgi:hypothetical protein